MIFFLHGDAWPKGVVPSADNFQSFWSFFLDKRKGVISLIYPLVNIQKDYRKSPCLMGQLTISMAIFHGYVSLPEGNKIKRMEPPQTQSPSCWLTQPLIGSGEGLSWTTTWTGTSIQRQSFTFLQCCVTETKCWRSSACLLCQHYCRKHALCSTDRSGLDVRKASGGWDYYYPTTIFCLVWWSDGRAVGRRWLLLKQLWKGQKLVVLTWALHDWVAGQRIQRIDQIGQASQWKNMYPVEKLQNICGYRYIPHYLQAQRQWVQQSAFGGDKWRMLVKSPMFLRPRFPKLFRVTSTLPFQYLNPVQRKVPLQRWNDCL